MSGYIEPKRQRDRREWFEEGERLQDLEEDFFAAKQAGKLTPELRRELFDARRAHRIRGEQSGKREGMVGVRTIWWRRWLEIGINHELDSREGFRRLVATESDNDSLLYESHNSVVAVCSAAFALEAVHNDVVYRIPRKEWKKGPTQLQRIRYALQTGWELDEPDLSALVNRIEQLLRRRGDAAHPYAETLPARPHPAGLNSGAEHEIFNAVTARDAIDLAIEVVRLTLSNPSPDLPPPYERWMLRWVKSRQPYRDQIQDMQDRRDRAPLWLPDLS